MSQDLSGGLEYALLKRHYDNYDYVQLSFAGPFAGAQQSYVVGTMAYLADPTLVTTKLGWTVYTPTAPVPLAYQVAGLAQGPAFEAKDILLYASQACTVSFDAPTRVAVSIPATTFMHFHQRCFVLYATQGGGTLDIWCEG
jgi:hypothetical protein